MAKYRDEDYEYEEERVAPKKKKSSGSGSGSKSGKKSSSKKSSGSTSSSARKGSGKKSSGKKSSKKAQAKKQRRRIIIFIIEIIILIIAVFVLYSVMSGTKSGKLDLNEDDIIINEQVVEAQETTMKGFRNIALFGVDSTTGALTKNTRSDTVMIASINQDTGECKLVSVYRDTYLNLSNDSYNKCNAAYAKGGPEMAISMLNLNLDLNITDFVTVGFAGLTDTVDALGGVSIEVDDVEISHLNNYQLCIAEDLKRTYTPVKSAGKQMLDGLQATGYCRIRYTAKKASLPQLTETANAVFNEVYTSLDLTEIIELLGNVNSYYISDTSGFPQESNRVNARIGSKGDCVIPLSLEDNVRWLHQFLFDDSSYEPSDDVKRCSEQIYNETNGYIKK